MGKLNPVSTKYIVQAHIEAEGTVERPDVIGAIFGQTEGFLGTELELRELQKTGKVGRIDVTLETKSGKTSGEVSMPCSLDQAEVAIIAATLETIERIGPCNAKIVITKLEDVRATKRNIVLGRAKELLKKFQSEVLPDSVELTNEVNQGVRVMGVVELGPDRLAAGPEAATSKEIILVEGRADVLSLLRSGIKNAVALNGTSVPPSISNICKNKIVTVFVDGDRGGDLIIRGLSSHVTINYIAKAPDGKEVEELAQKEVNMALRSKVPFGKTNTTETRSRVPTPRYNNNYNNGGRTDTRSTSSGPSRDTRPRTQSRDTRTYTPRPRTVKRNRKAETVFKGLLNDLVGTKGAYLVDKDLNILGKVPLIELTNTLRELHNIYAVVLDGEITKEIAYAAERGRLEYVVGMTTKLKHQDTKVMVIVQSDFNS